MRTSEEIIKIIKEICNSEGITTTELATMVGLSKSAISKYFNGTREFPLNRVGDFATALNIETEYLLGLYPANEEIKEIKETNLLQKKRDLNISKSKDENCLVLKINIDPLESQMIDVLKQLNTKGQNEALKRIKEMLCIPAYINS